MEGVLLQLEQSTYTGDALPERRHYLCRCGLQLKMRVQARFGRRPGEPSLVVLVTRTSVREEEAARDMALL